MKKLTAGIFTVLMGLVTVNAAEAAVASKGYVDAKVGTNTSAIETLTQTVAQNKTDAAAATKQVADDLAEYETANDQAVSDLDGRLDTAEGSITTLRGDVAALSGDGENSVATQIANALTEANDYTDAEVKKLADGAVAGNTAAISEMGAAYKAADTTLQGNIDALSGTVTTMDGAYKAADAQTLADAKSYADGLATNYDASGSAAQALTDAKAYADGLATNYDAKGSAAQALTDAKAYADGLDSAQKTAFENADKAINDKIGTVAEGKTVVEMIADAQQAATFDPTEIKADIKANADAIDVIEASDYATSGITAAKVSAYDAYNTTITANTAAAEAAQTAADNAQATANAAIPAPTGPCQDAENKCVLTYNNTAYTWEVIERATDETVE